MLEFIKNILSNISNFFTAVWGFLVDLIEDLVYMVKLLGQIVADIPSLFSWLPAGVLALFIALVGIVVVYKIIGRTE